MLNWNIIKKTFKKSKGLYLSLLGLTIVFMSISFLSVKMLAPSITTKTNESDDPTWYNTYSTLYFGSFGLIIIGVLAAMLPIIVLTSEIDDSSLTIYLVSGNSRSRVLLNKFASIFVMMMFYSLIQTVIVGIGFSQVLFDKKYLDYVINDVWTYFCGATTLMAVNYLICSAVQSKKNVFMLVGIVSFITIILPMMYKLTGQSALEFCQYTTLFAYNNAKLIKKDNFITFIPYIVYIAVMPGIIVWSNSIFKKRRLYL